MKRFLLFAGVGVGSGGCNDFKCSYDTFDEAKNAGKKENNGGLRKYQYDWYHIVDLQGSGGFIAFSNRK